MHMVPEARWTRNLLAVLLLWPSKLAAIVSLREFGPTLTSYRTHRRTNNFPIDDANCRVAVFKPGPLQWICKEWVRKLGSNKATARFEGGKAYRIGRLKGPREKEPLARGLESPTPLASLEPFPLCWAPSFPVRSLLIYILLLHSSSSYTCRSSTSIFECTSHRPLFLSFCELLWPPSHCPGVTSTSIGFRGLAVYLIRRWQLFLGLLFYHAPMASP